jgi:pectinesterase
MVLPLVLALLTTAAPRVWNEQSNGGDAVALKRYPAIIGSPAPDPATAIRVGRSAAAQAATIAAGLALVPRGRWTERWTVEVEPGVYRERVWVDASMGPLTLTGLGAPEDTLLVYHCCYRGDGTPRCSNATVDGSCAPLDGGAGTGPNRVTSRTGTLLVEAADFMALNISIANDACSYDSGRAAQSQAVQLLADRAAFRHARLLGAQDTVFAGGKKPGDRQYFLQSYINGSCDSIYGTSSMVFDQCVIAITGHVTAMKGAEFAPSDDRGGRASYVFYKSSLVKPVQGQQGYPAKDGGTDLGRPWSFVVYPNGSSAEGGHSLAAVVYHSCFMDAHIAKTGWSDWGNGCGKRAGGGKGCTATLDAFGKVQTGNPSCWCQNITYLEQGSYGPGASPATRVKWSHQITEKDLHPGGILGALGLRGTTPRSAMGTWAPPWPAPSQLPARLKIDEEVAVLLPLNLKNSIWRLLIKTSPNMKTDDEAGASYAIPQGGLADHADASVQGTVAWFMKTHGAARGTYVLTTLADPGSPASTIYTAQSTLVLPAGAVLTSDAGSLIEAGPGLDDKVLLRMGNSSTVENVALHGNSHAQNLVWAHASNITIQNTTLRRTKNDYTRDGAPPSGRRRPHLMVLAECVNAVVKGNQMRHAGFPKQNPGAWGGVAAGVYAPSNDNLTVVSNDIAFTLTAGVDFTGSINVDVSNNTIHDTGKNSCDRRSHLYTPCYFCIKKALMKYTGTHENDVATHG